MTPLAIQLLSDADSWIRPHLEPLIGALTAAGHTVRLDAHHADAAPADVCFCLGYGRIIDATARAVFGRTLVVHESDLPHGRGWAPMAWQILAGADRIIVSLIEAVDAVDAGPIHLQETIVLSGTELCPEWRRLQAEATCRLCLRWVASWPAHVVPRPQTGDPTVFRRRRPADSELDPDATLAAQFDLLRVVDNERYPAFFTHRGRRYRLLIEPHD